MCGGALFPWVNSTVQLEKGVLHSSAEQAPLEISHATFATLRAFVEPPSKWEILGVETRVSSRIQLTGRRVEITGRLESDAPNRVMGPLERDAGWRGSLLLVCLHSTPQHGAHLYQGLLLTLTFKGETRGTNAFDELLCCRIFVKLQ